MISEVHNMDCMEYMKNIPDKYFDLSLVDPPYGIGMSKSAGKSKKTVDKGWDNSAPDKEYFLELQRVSKNQVIFGANHFIENIPNGNSACWIIWDKREGFIPERTYADAEMAYTSFSSPTRVFRHYWDGFLQRVKEVRIHETQKPTHLYTWILERFAKPGQIILDTHLGSGSSRIAAYDLGFDFYGCEKDYDYWFAAENRFKKYISQQKLFTPQQQQECQQIQLL